MTISGREEYVKLFDGLSEYGASADSADEIMLQSLLLKLIYKLIREAAPRSEGSPRGSLSPAIDKVIHYIKENLSADLSLAALSEYAGFSPIHFHNLFKSATGRRLRDFVEEKRIRAAAGLILAGEKNLTEIAYECGFSSQSYFSYAFKRRMGTTPRGYARSVSGRYSDKGDIGN